MASAATVVQPLFSEGERWFLKEPFVRGIPIYPLTEEALLDMAQASVARNLYEIGPLFTSAASVGA